MSTSPKLIWQNILEILSQGFQSSTMKEWLSSIKPQKVEDNTIYLEAPNKYFAEWVEEQYGEEFRSLLKKYNIENLIWVYEENRSGNLFERKPQINASFLRRSLRFENFIVGKENEIIYNIAISIAKNPSKSYNPFYIYGKSGLGKTHLISAIGNKALEIHKNYKVRYITIESFFNELINAIKNQSTSSFRNQYRQADMLIIDNFDFIEDKPALQEEILHTIDYLLSKNGQIIIAGIKHIKSLKIREEIKNRILKGIVMEIACPSFETRYQILSMKAKEEKLDIEDEILWEIARANILSVRELEGAIARISAYYSFSNGKIGHRVFKDLLSDLVSNRKESYDISKIVEIVCNKFHVDEEYLKSKVKTKELLYLRYAIVFIARSKFNMTYTSIAKALKRDHSSIINAYNKARKMILKDTNFKKIVEKIEKSL